MQALNNLNIDSHKQNDQAEHETVISHLVRIKKSDKTSICDEELLNSNRQQTGYLEKAMEVAHDSNKKVLQYLLNRNMLESIGLKGQV